MFLAIRSLTKMYGPAIILDDISLIVNAGERVGLVGANGVGKSTLLKIILGDVEADAGTVVFAPNIEYGYLAQQLATMPGQTIEAVLWDSQRQLRHIQARLDGLATLMHSAQDERLAAILAEYGALAERFEHRGGYAIDHPIDYVLAGLGLSHLPRDRSVEQISGGEKTRLGLAALLISAPDLLLLDEPTNHLDFAAVAWLETFLRERRGAVLTISHDRQFLNRIATTIVEIDEHTHKARTYAGNYAAFLAQKQLERRRWEEEYQRQQAEIGDLQQRMKAQNQRVGHNRPASDGDKIAYKAAGERVARQFEAALQRFPGPVIAVSHDRWFIQYFRGAIWLLDRARLIIDREQVLARLPALDLG